MSFELMPFLLRRWVEMFVPGLFVYADRAAYTETYITSCMAYGALKMPQWCCADAASISFISEVILLPLSCLRP
jgi:hypothetical protein